MSAAVAGISQRNQATLPGHLVFVSVFNFFNRLAKAFGFCLYFYCHVMLALNLFQGGAPFEKSSGSKPGAFFVPILD